MSTREADIVIVLVMINNVLLICNGRFMLLRLEMSFDLLAYINRLDEGINLSTEIAELVSYRICRETNRYGAFIALPKSC